MRSKWRLKKGSDTLIIVRRADLYPEELRLTGAKLSDGDLDNWLDNEGTRKLALEIFESINGRSQLDLKRANADELRRSVKPKLFQAFKRGDLIALRIPQLFLTQSPIEAALEEAQQAAARKKQSPPSPPPPKQKTWIEIQLLDEEGNPLPKEQYRLELPDGAIEDGFLDKDGRARRDGIDPGMCKVSFPYLELVPKRKTPPQPDNPPKPEEKKVTVTIKAENGTDAPPAKIPVKGSIKLKAVPSEGTGTFQWKTTSAKITLANDTAQVVTVTAGGDASAALNAETVELIFTPSGQAALAPVTQGVTVFTAAFSESPTQKYGYDDMDNAAGVLHHVSVKKNDTTTVRVKVAGGLTGADLKFTSDDATIADATPPAGAGAEFDLTINGKAKNKNETTIHARAFNASGAILASIKVNVYKEKAITAKVAKIHDSTVAASALSRPNFDVEAAETEINKWYKALVATIDLTDNSATGGATDVNYDLNGNGRLDLEPGTTSREEAKIKAAFNPAGQKVVIVKELAWLFFLKTAAAVSDTTITLKDAYAGHMKFIHVGDVYNLGDGANQESIKVNRIAGTTITLDVALTKAHPVTDGLIYELNGLSGNPIYVKEQGLSEAQVRQVIGHENGHSQLSLKDLTPTPNLMHNSTQTRTDIKLRFKELARRHDPGNENQWETVPR